MPENLISAGRFIKHFHLIMSPPPKKRNSDYTVGLHVPTKETGTFSLSLQVVLQDFVLQISVPVLRTALAGL